MKITRGAQLSTALLLPLMTVALATPAAAAAYEARLLLDDGHRLVVENTYPPGSESPLHTHRWPRTVYVLAGGELELVDGEGEVRRLEVASGELTAHPPETHQVRNVGATTVRTLETEVRPVSGPPATAFVGGLWFDGESFVSRTLYSVDGVFTDQRPDVLDEIVDLEGLYVVPPFGEAHAHHFDAAPLFPRINSMYLAEGIFYGISMTNSIKGKRAVAPLAAQPKTIDVAYADAGVTATFGHPIMVYETLARGGYDFDTSLVERGLDPQAQDDAYIVIDNADDLDARWEDVTASRPDLVKVYILYSERYEELRDKRDTYGDRGLDPALVPAIVERAHRSGLRVAAHVETAADFRVAVSSGVDILAHLPGYSPHKELGIDAYRLTAADAEAAAAAGIVMVPTPLSSAESRYAESDPTFLVEVRKLHVDNIGALVRAGVPMAIGADTYFATASRDAFLLHAMGLFSNLEMLRMWSETTPALAFPERRIGRLEPGYEASLLALAANPLEDFTAVREIEVRFKQGRRLEHPPEPAPRSASESP